MSKYVIVGANSEIGQALWQYLIDKGHDVLLVSRSKKRNLSLELKWLDGINLTKETDLVKLREFIHTHFNSPFTVIHSVGDFWKHKAVTSTCFDEVVSQIQSHYVTLFGVIKAVVPIMQEVGGGMILAFSCNSVKYNYPDMAAFTSAKAAVECLIKCTANEQSQYNIVANAFALPSIQTQSVIETKPKEYHKNYVTLGELTQCIEQAVENSSLLTNGNIISIFKHSDSFYHKGYYERNIIWEAKENEGVGGVL